jgi:hypothetical protein
MDRMPCVLCGKSLEKRTDRDGKPYFVCDPCGIQFFIRRAAGIERLEALLAELGRRDALFNRTDGALFEVQSLLRELEGLSKEISRLDEKAGWFFVDEEAARARDALKVRHEGVFKRLEAMCAKGNAL